MKAMNSIESSKSTVLPPHPARAVLRGGYDGNIILLPDIDLNDLFDDLQLVTLSVPTEDIVTLDPLPSLWDQHPPHPASQAVGDLFVAEGYALVLKVPSVVIRGDNNYLIHPGHARFRDISIVSIAPFQFDQRLNR